MKKASLFAISLASALLMGGFSMAPVAHAQVYTNYGTSYGTPTYVTGYAGICTQLTAPLTIGSSDALTSGQVSSLQRYLSQVGLMSSTLATGYYGSVTASAVSEFQSTHGIQSSGVVGPLTRAAIEQASCGGTSIVSPAQPIYPTNPVYPTNPIYPINPGGPISYGYYPPELTSITANYTSGQTVLTLNGYGFNPTNNTVLFGNVTLSDISSNGTTLTFTAPNVGPGIYDVYVTTSYGTSKALLYTLSNNYGTTNNCGSNTINPFNGGSCNNCVYNNYQPYSSTNFAYNNCASNSQTTLNSLSTTSGVPGTTVTAFGSGFSPNGNIVHFGGTQINNVSSTNGNQITFTVPYVNNTTSSGSYSVYITNNNGSSSNGINFSVSNNNNTCNVYSTTYPVTYSQCGNQYGNQYGYGSVNISYLSPAQGSAGTQIAIEGTGFSSTGNTIYFSNGSSQTVQAYNNGTTLYYTIPFVQSGSYPIYVRNGNGQNSNTVSFQVF